MINVDSAQLGLCTKIILLGKKWLMTATRRVIILFLKPGNQSYNLMKQTNIIPMLLAAVTSLSLTTHAAYIVNDTWIDGTRTDPATPTDSEYGVDGDLDGNIESRWANAGGTMNVINANPTVTPGLLRTTVPTAGSASWTSYFTPDATPVSLLNAGDKMTIRWVFSPTAPVSATSGNQNLRIAIVDSPAATRLAADGAPGTGAYTGYGVFGTFSTTLGATPLRLMERVNPAGNFLSTSGEYAQRATAGTSGNIGYVQGTTYTLVFTAERTAASALDITLSMSGGSINGGGVISMAFTDTTPNSFTFDTFGVRPQTGALTSEQIDTSLFQVEFDSVSVPEPTAAALLGVGIMGLIAARRNRC